MVTGNPVEAATGKARATKDVTATDHQPNLDATGHQLSDLTGHPPHNIGVDTKIAGAHQRLAAEL